MSRVPHLHNRHERCGLAVSNIAVAALVFGMARSAQIRSAYLKVAVVLSVMSASQFIARIVSLVINGHASFDVLPTLLPLVVLMIASLFAVMKK